MQKPGKPAGPVKNIRPIVLLPLLCKLLSIIVFNRIRKEVDMYLSPAQSGFRCGRSCADIVWAHIWLVAKTVRYKAPVHILDDFRLIQFLLANSTLQVHFNRILTAPFTSNICSPQGDGLSPILFAIYLESAMQSLRSHGLVRPEADNLIGLPESLCR